MINNTMKWVVTEVRRDENDDVKTVVTEWDAFTPLFDYMIRSAANGTDEEFILEHIADRLGVEITGWRFKH